MRHKKVLSFNCLIHSDYHCHSPGSLQPQGGLIDEVEPKDQYLQGYSTHGGCPFDNSKFNS